MAADTNHDNKKMTMIPNPIVSKSTHPIPECSRKVKLVSYELEKLSGSNCESYKN